MIPNLPTDSLSVHAEYHGWDKLRGSKDIFEKDGYELYFRDDGGLELVIRDPESKKLVNILKVTSDDAPIHSPMYVALIEHILSNAENIVSRRLK